MARLVLAVFWGGIFSPTWLQIPNHQLASPYDKTATDYTGKD